MTTGICRWTSRSSSLPEKARPVSNREHHRHDPVNYATNTIAFARIVDEIGLPRGVFNLVLGRGETVGQDWRVTQGRNGQYDRQRLCR
ncbi:aldehyde dehydrogenase family protein [Shigella flexneri]